MAGIGFDATCALVVLGESGRPLPVGPTDDSARINARGHEVLKYIGGRISPEMQTPKLRRLPVRITAPRPSINLPRPSKTC